MGWEIAWRVDVVDKCVSDKTESNSWNALVANFASSK